MAMQTGPVKVPFQPYTYARTRPHQAGSCLQVRAPMPPRFFFVIDVSYVAANAGALPVICQAIKDSLDRLPGGERTQIGFLTFDSTLHFYNLASRLSQPQMMVRPALLPFFPDSTLSARP